MGKKFVILFLSLGLSSFFPAYTMDNKSLDPPEENELDFDLKGLALSFLIAVIGIYYLPDGEIPNTTK